MTHAYPTGELMLRLSTGVPDSVFHPGELASESVAAPADWAAWLECRLARAGLLASQSPHAIGALENPRWRGAEPDEPIAPVHDPDAAGREDAIAALYHRLWASPPSLLGPAAKPLDSRARAAISRSRAGHGQQMTAFDIRKPGSDAPYGIWGTPDRYAAMRDPVHVGGPTAQAALCTFDSSRNGWDGEHGLAPKRRPRTPEAYHCQRCGHDRFRCRALFEYGDPDDYQDPDVAARPQDFFSWFSLVATCAQCDRKKELLSVECA